MTSDRLRMPAAAPALPAPLPRGRGRGPAIALLTLALLGLALAAYLSVIHYALLFGNLTLGAFCGLGPGGDCNAVLASRYASLAGLPLAVWGVGFYLIQAALAVGVLRLGAPERGVRESEAPEPDADTGATFARAAAGLALAALALDAYLLWAQWARLERFCPLCLASYGVNAAIFGFAIARAQRAGSGAGLGSLLPRLGQQQPGGRPPSPRHSAETFKAWLWVSTLVVLVVTGGTALAIAKRASGLQARQLAGLLSFLRDTEPVPIDVTGRPARGPADAAVTLVVFSDFLCDQCRRASHYLDIVAANHRADLRVVYCHLPADSSCNPGLVGARHPGACKLALAAEAARARGRFWEFHDAVFTGETKLAPERLAGYAARAGLDPAALETGSADPEALHAVEADAVLARALEVTVTPTVFYNGRAVAGALEPWLMERAIAAVREADARRQARE